MMVCCIGIDEDLKSVLGTASIMEQKRFLKSFVSSVDVSKSEVTVNYTLPMPPLNMYQDTVGVLALGRSGRPCMSKGRTKTFSETFALVY